MMPASLELVLWVALLTFPLIQIALLLLAQGDVDAVTRYLSAHGPAINVISFVPFVFAMLHAVAFLSYAPSGWNAAIMALIVITIVLLVTALTHLQSFAADLALQKSAKAALPKPKHRRP